MAGLEWTRVFHAMHLQGREFSADDTAGSDGVVIMNETMAQHYFKDRSAIGRRVRFNRRDYAVIGVAKDAKYGQLRESPSSLLYFAFQQSGAGMNTLQLRTTALPLQAVEPVRAAIRDADARLVIREIAPFSQFIDRSLAPEYLVAGLSNFFGGLTLLLVSIGLYGTLAFTVVRRTNEIGLRMALGARPGAVMKMVLKDILWPVAGGVVVGMAAVSASGPLISSLLFGLRPADPWTLGSAALLFCGVAFVAAYVPARRASRVVLR